MCKESSFTQVQMLKSFNSLLIKLNVSTQETSSQNFFSSPLSVHELFFDNSLVQECFSYAYSLEGYFFQTHPTPLQKLNGWPLSSIDLYVGRARTRHRSIFKLRLLILAKETVYTCRQKKLTPNIMLFKSHVKHVRY